MIILAEAYLHVVASHVAEQTMLYVSMIINLSHILWVLIVINVNELNSKFAHSYIYILIYRESKYIDDI